MREKGFLCFLFVKMERNFDMDMANIMEMQSKHQMAMNILTRKNNISGNRRAMSGMQTSTISNILSTQKKNAFGFIAVEISADMVHQYYGDTKISGTNPNAKTAGSKAEKDFVEIDSEKVKAVELPKNFDELKELNVYYHGKMISEYELVQTAVAAGKLEVDVDTKNVYGIGREAFNLMIRDEAAAKYAWSDTLYSEDGRYTFTKDEDGRLKMHFVDDEGMGASVEDIANWLMSGTPCRNIETRYLHYLQSVDPDLYNAARRIGSEVQTNTIMNGLYETGVIGEKQNDYDMGLLGMLFGKDAGEMRLSLQDCKRNGNFLPLLDSYQPSGADALLKLRLKQSEQTNGGVV